MSESGGQRTPETFEEKAIHKRTFGPALDRQCQNNVVKKRVVGMRGRLAQLDNASARPPLYGMSEISFLLILGVERRPLFRNHYRLLLIAAASIGPDAGERACSWIKIPHYAARSAFCKARMTTPTRINPLEALPQSTPQLPTASTSITKIISANRHDDQDLCSTRR